MRRLYALVLLCALLATPVAQAATGYSTQLKGSNEVPANPSTATGFATVVLNNAGTQLAYTVTYSGLLGTLTASHIHRAAAGSNGPVTFGFAPPVGTQSGTFSGTINVTPANVADLNAGLYYVNVHSSLYPGGELRGQIVADATPNARGTWGRIKSLFR